MAEILSKSAYAARRGRGPSAVSNWIRSGQLSAPALRPDGKIDAELADGQLAKTLDPVRSAAQRLPVASNTSGSDPAKQAQAEYLRARALSASVRAERERRELNAQRGRYMLTEEARAEWARGIMDHLQSVEQSLPDLADRLGIGWDGLLKLRRWWRARCEYTANRNRLAAASVPDFKARP